MNKVAVVTGAAQGIGAAVAMRFKQDGFTGLVLVDRDAAGVERTAKALAIGIKVSTVVVDLADDAAALDVFAALRQHHDHIDVLVNAAGNTERCGIENTTPDSYRRIFDVNVKAPLFMMQEAIKLMKPKKSGVIINMSSMLAHGGPPMLTTYSASKGALSTMTKAVANAVKRDNIRAFAVNLGWINSDGEHKLQTNFHGMPQDWADAIGKRMPFGRMITPEDVAGLCSFLCTGPAQMMTGTIIDYEQMPVGVYDEHPALAPL